MNLLLGDRVPHRNDHFRLWANNLKVLAFITFYSLIISYFDASVKRSLFVVVFHKIGLVELDKHLKNGLLEVQFCGQAI